MTVALRGHHLLCVLTYIGRGYSRDFVDNYDTVIRRLEHEEVLIVSGPGDICRPLLESDAAHCRFSRVSVRDRHALEAASRLLGQDVEVGATLNLNVSRISRLRSAFRTGEIRLACQGCEWSDLCTAIAQNEFRAACFNPSADV